MPDSVIYHYFLQRGLTRSQRHFSTEYLQAAPNYLALRGNRGPSANALIGLFQRLWFQGRPLLAIRVGWTILWLPEGQR